MGKKTGLIRGPQMPPAPKFTAGLLSPYRFLDIGQKVEWQIAGYTFILAYFLAVFGAFAHLESMSRRTAGRGRWNWFYLVLASISLGGAATSSMQVINEGIKMGWHEKSLQKAYHPIWAFVTLFAPVIWYIAIFAVTLYKGEKPHLVRNMCASSLAGAGIIGSHYLHQLTITNYTIEYNKAFVIGSFILPVGGYALVLWLMFSIRAMYILRWGRQLVLSTLLAAVTVSSYMIAVLGTTYRAKFDPNFLRNYKTRKFLPLAAWLFGTASILLVLAFMIEGRIFHNRLKNQSKKLLLASAIFTRDGRVMVQVNGVLPHVVVDDGVSENELEKALLMNGPLFDWFYRQTRNWKTLEPFKNMLKFQHEAWTSLERVDLRNLDDREVNRYLVYKLWTACERLSKLMCCKLEEIGAFYEDICPVGTKWRYVVNHERTVEEFETKIGLTADVEEGRLMTLVRCVDEEEEASMKTKGFRFTHINNISHCFEWFFQMDRKHAMAYANAMQRYAVTMDKHMIDSGVYLALFAAKPGIGPATSAFSVIVPSHCRNRIPMVKMEHLKVVHQGHIKLLERYNLKTLNEVIYGLLREEYPKANGPMQLFIREFVMSLRIFFIEMNGDWVQDAKFCSEAIRMPARKRDPKTGKYTATGEAFVFSCRYMIDLHDDPHKNTNLKYEMVPMEFLKNAQRHREADAKVFGINTGRQVLNWTKDIAGEKENLKNVSLLRKMEKVIVEARKEGYEIMPNKDASIIKVDNWFAKSILKCLGSIIPFRGQLPQIPKNRDVEVETWVDKLFKGLSDDTMNDPRRKQALGAGLGYLNGGNRNGEGKVDRKGKKPMRNYE